MAWRLKLPLPAPFMGMAAKDDTEANMWLKTLADDITYAPLEARPREERQGVDLPVRCKMRGHRAQVVLKNITTGGARIEDLRGLRYDEAITLQLPGLKPKTAFVMWVKADTAGIAFERPIHPDVLSEIVRKHGSRRPLPPLELAEFPVARAAA